MPPESEQSIPVPESALEATQESTEPAAAEEAKTQPQKEEQDSDESQEQEGGRKLPQLTEEQAALPWYVVHTYSGF